MYGDIDTAEKVVQGMNMIFNSSGWYSASGAQFNAGGFFTFAVMLTLWGSILAWFIHQRLNLGPVLLAFLIYIVMTVPRTPLMIEDVFSGDTRVVADTPLGIAVVASLGSTIAKKMADQFDTVFTPIGSTSTMYNNGFASNLQLMLSLRKIITTPKNPYFFTNFARYMATCAKLSTSTTSYDAATGKVAYLLSNYDNTAGPITYQTITYPDGRGVSCATAASDLSTELTNYMQGLDGQASVDLNAAIAAPTGTAYSSMAQPRYVFQNDVVQAVQEGTGMSQLQARNFMTDLLFNQWAIGSMGCGSAADETAFQECVTSITEASETAKIDSAMQASIFQKIMIPLMNLLTYLFYGLAPIVIVVAVATGIAGISIILKYALFGFWIQSWMPAAILINYITMEQTKTAFKNFYWSWQHGAFNPIHFYDIVSTKLMVSSEILAATPMITLAILGGGAYAMTNIAGAAGKSASSKTDASSASPKLRKVEPLSTYGGKKVSNAWMQVGPGSKYTRGSSVADPNAYLKGLAGNVNFTKEASSAVSGAKQRAKTARSAVAASRQRLAQRTEAAINQIGSNITGQSQTTTQGSFADSLAATVAKDLGYDKKLTNEQAYEVMARLGAKLQGIANGSFSGKNAEKELQQALGSIASVLGVEASAGATGKIANKLLEGAEEGHKVNQQNLKEGRLTESDVGALLRQAIESDTAQFQQMAQETEQYQQQYEEALAEQQSITETAQQVQSATRASGGSIAEVLANRWQAGDSGPSASWNQDRFNQFVDNMRDKGYFGSGPSAQNLAQNTKVQFAQRLDDTRQQLHKMGYHRTMTPEQLDAISNWVAYQDTAMPTARASSKYSSLKLDMAKDYLGLSSDTSAITRANQQIDDLSGGIGHPDSHPVQDILDTKGEGGLFDAASQAYDDKLVTTPTPSAMHNKGVSMAKQRAKGGKTEAKKHFDNSKVGKTAKSKIRIRQEAIDDNGFINTAQRTDNVFNRLDAMSASTNASDLREAATKLLTDELDPEKQDPLGVPNATVHGIMATDALNNLTRNRGGAALYTNGIPDPDKTMRFVFNKEADVLGLSDPAKQRYVQARMAGLETNLKGRAYAELGEVLRQNKPVPQEYASMAEYEHALHGWNAARLVATEQSGAPGLPDNNPELEELAEKGIDLPPLSSRQNNSLVNPAGLGRDRSLVILIERAANDPP